MNRIAMWIARRVPQFGRDALCQVVGDHVFEALRLGVDLVPGHVELRSEKELKQAMTPHHLQDHPFAARR